MRNTSCALILDHCEAEEEGDGGYANNQDESWDAHSPLSRWKVAMDRASSIEEWL